MSNIDITPMLRKVPGNNTNSSTQKSHCDRGCTLVLENTAS